MSSMLGMVPNPGLPMSAPMHYGKTMILYTAQEKVEAVVDGAPPGPNGRLFIVEVNDPTEVPWEAGRFILEHLAYTGVVKVDEIETRDAKGKRTGVEYDVEKAHAESLALGEQMDRVRWQRFVNDMMDDYVSRKDGKSKAVPQPPDSILRIMKRRGFKLDDYGIKPVGFEDPTAAENKALREQLAELSKRLTAMEGKDVQTRESGNGGEPDTSGGKPGTRGRRRS